MCSKAQPADRDDANGAQDAHEEDMSALPLGLTLMLVAMLLALNWKGLLVDRSFQCMGQFWLNLCILSK